jgi:hypothetical protein
MLRSGYQIQYEKTLAGSETASNIPKYTFGFEFRRIKTEFNLDSNPIQIKLGLQVGNICCIYEIQSCVPNVLTRIVAFLPGYFFGWAVFDRKFFGYCDLYNHRVPKPIGYYNII